MRLIRCDYPGCHMSIPGNEGQRAHCRDHLLGVDISKEGIRRLLRGLRELERVVANGGHPEVK